MEGAVTESIYAYRQCILVSKWERRQKKMGPGRKNRRKTSGKTGGKSWYMATDGKNIDVLLLQNC